MKNNEYTSVCNVCYAKGWHTEPKKCVRKYSQHCKECHQVRGDREMKECTGTNVIIEYDQLPELIRGERYTFEDRYGTQKRFTFGVTTGWKPVGLLLHNARARGSSNIIRKSDILNSIYSSVIKTDLVF